MLSLKNKGLEKAGKGCPQQVKKGMVYWLGKVR